MFKDWNKFEKSLIIFATLTIFALGLYWNDSWLGIVCSVTGVLCVILTAKGKLSCYVWGLINILAYIVLSYNQKFYGEVMLNGFYYLPMQFIGFYLWKNNMNDTTNTVNCERLNTKNRLILLVLSIIGVFGYGYILQRIGGNLPYVDSMSTVLSIFAMVLSVKRYMEQWIVWIVVDVVTIIMWAFAFFTTGNDIAVLIMWIVYLINAIYGYIKWNKESKICID